MKRLFKFICMIFCTNILITNCFQSQVLAFGEDSSGIISEIKWIVGNNNTNPSSSLLDSIKTAINRILGMLATIALVICMYSWFKMLTSWWDSKWYEAWIKTLKNAILWLAIIWIAWLIVSFVFRFIELIWS